jgi:hypothetical protein
LTGLTKETLGPLGLVYGFTKATQAITASADSRVKLQAFTSDVGLSPAAQNASLV